MVSGRSNRHVSAICEHLMSDMKDEGFGHSRIEGLENGDWVVIDAGDVIIHVFRPEVRAFYNIERCGPLPTLRKKRCTDAVSCPMHRIGRIEIRSLS